MGINFMHKKGDINWESLISVVASVLIGLSLIAIIALWLNLIPGLSPKCDNEISWKGLKETLAKTEYPDFATQEVFFINKGCTLVAYNPG